MTIITAYNEEMQDCGHLCVESIKRYVQGKSGETSYQVSAIPKSYKRKPSWFKVGLISSLVLCPTFTDDFILWIDADTLIAAKDGIEEMIQDCTLNIAKDSNGINCGVMAWKNCGDTVKAMSNIEALYPKYKDHPWWEQAALMEIIDTMDVCYQPKEIWNSYPSHPDAQQRDYIAGKTKIIHFPGLKPDVRIKEMNMWAGITGN